MQCPLLYFMAMHRPLEPMQGAPLAYQIRDFDFETVMLVALINFPVELNVIILCR